jgi:hypothetical protein
MTTGNYQDILDKIENEKLPRIKQEIATHYYQEICACLDNIRQGEKSFEYKIGFLEGVSHILSLVQSTKKVKK